MAGEGVCFAPKISVGTGASGRSLSREDGPERLAEAIPAVSGGEEAGIQGLGKRSRTALTRVRLNCTEISLNSSSWVGEGIGVNRSAIRVAIRVSRSVQRSGPNSKEFGNCRRM